MILFHALNIPEFVDVQIDFIYISYLFIFAETVLWRSESRDVTSLLLAVPTNMLHFIRPPSSGYVNLSILNHSVYPTFSHSFSQSYVTSLLRAVPADMLHFIRPLSAG